MLYTFVSWSDGGAASHTITTPETETTWTATFRKIEAADGIGLTGAYFSKPGFTGTSTNRIDPTINFNWGTGSPVSGIGPDGWSARWTAWLRGVLISSYRQVMWLTVPARRSAAAGCWRSAAL